MLKDEAGPWKTDIGRIDGSLDSRAGLETGFNRAIIWKSHKFISQVTLEKELERRHHPVSGSEYFLFAPKPGNRGARIINLSF